MPLSIAVFVSGNGSNLQAIIDAIDKGELPITLTAVIADRPCLALERAERHHIPHYLVKRSRTMSQDIDHILQGREVGFIVLAGFLSILSEEFCQRWANKIINLHPSLLPKYGGAGMWGEHVHHAVIQHREKESGATVHFVTAGIDEGEIIAQAKCEVSANDTATSLAEKVHQLEHPLLIETLKKLAEGK